MDTTVSPGIEASYHPPSAAWRCGLGWPQSKLYRFYGPYWAHNNSTIEIYYLLVKVTTKLVFFLPYVTYLMFGTAAAPRGHFPPPIPPPQFSPTPVNMKKC